jgi:hypothetical protein
MGEGSAKLRADHYGSRYKWENQTENMNGNGHGEVKNGNGVH